MKIFGILSAIQDDEWTNRPFGAQSPMFEAILACAQKAGWESCVITPGVRVPGERLQAFTWTENRWVATELPWPHVVYNRLPSRALEKAPEFRAFYQMLKKKTKGRIFNRSGYFSKLTIYSLVKDIHMDGLRVPVTEAVTGARQVLLRANEWGELWLKPDDGSLGRGIYRMVQDPVGFTFDSSDHASSEHRSVAELTKQLRGVLSKGRYLLQQGIARAEYQRRPFDIRVLLHKNQLGKFKVTGQFARLTDDGQIVSNLTAGGEAIDVRQILAPQEINQLRTIALTMSQRLQKKIPAPLGELGLDFAMDEERRQFWLLEANSKPFLKMQPGDPMTQRVAKSIVSYAGYLLRLQTSTRRTATLRQSSKLVPRGWKDR